MPHWLSITGEPLGDNLESDFQGVYQEDIEHGRLLILQAYVPLSMPSTSSINWAKAVSTRAT